MEEIELIEKKLLSKPTSAQNNMSLERAIELGEYNPKYLAVFPEWHMISRHVQFEFIRRGLENHNRQLIKQWAEITNTLNFRLKPHLKEALKNIEKKLEKLNQDKERLYVEYSM